MDHRCSARIPLNLNLDLYYRDRPLGRFTTRDIDSSGAFIQSKLSAITANTVVDLHFISDNSNDKPLQRKGLVVRSGSKGIAVLFSDKQSNFREILDTEALNS